MRGAERAMMSREELRGTERNLRGAERNRGKPRGIERNREESRGAERNREEPRGPEASPSLNHLADGRMHGLMTESPKLRLDV